MNKSSTPSWAARLVQAQLRWFYRPLMAPWLPLPLQRALAGLLRWTVPTPPGVATRPLRLGATSGHTHQAHAAAVTGRTVLYFHGGGYSVCSPHTHRSLAMHLAKESARKVHVPHYRLAPEHPYPAQLEDALRAMADLELAGADAAQMVVAGDSAGAHLALTLALARRDAGLPLPQALVLISPCADWSLTDLPPDTDALLGLPWVRHSRDGYVRAERLREALVSPIHASLHGLPPTLIQSAGAELFARDAQRLHARLADAGVPVQWQEWPGLWHDFQLHAALVPEALAAVQRIGTFIRGVDAATLGASKGTAP